MATITHYLQINWSGSSGVPVPSTQTLTGDVEVNLSQQVTATTVDQALPYACPVAALQEFFALSDQAVQLNFNAIHSGAPILTLNLAAGVPYIWTAASGLANPFTGAVTSLYSSNAGAVAANLIIKSLHN
jgi:hypothetical protein